MSRLLFDFESGLALFTPAASAVSVPARRFFTRDAGTWAFEWVIPWGRSAGPERGNRSDPPGASGRADVSVI